MTKSTYLFAAICGLFFAACTNEDDQKELRDAVIEVETDDVFGSDKFEFVLPRPFALAASFQEAGMVYKPGRTNPVSNVSNYNTKGAQLINFGVYSTDLVYNIINEQPQQTMEYFNTLKQLADKFGMGSIFTEDDLALEIEKNITDRETLEELLVDVHERSQEYLEDNDMRYLSVIQFAGAWIEGMYLASFDFVKQERNVVSVKITDHMTLVNNTIKGLESYNNKDEAIENILSYLIDYRTMYENFESVKATGGQGFPELTQEEINQVAEKIQSIRARIIA
jgi:hypothetical protein